MGLPLIEEMLSGESKELRDLVRNEPILVGFLTLTREIDDLPDLEIRFYQDSRSLYQVTAIGHAVSDLMACMTGFFGKPAKAPGKNLPVTLRFEPCVKHLGGIRKEQALFLKKLKTGTFYGALWPWQRDPQKTEVHLGYSSPTMPKDDYHRLGDLVKKFLSKKKIESVSGVGGQIHGISLPSFLQMSEMEGATYTLNVTSAGRNGYLYLDGGSLIGARFEQWRGNGAAYRIISWDDAAIQIEPADPDQVREIHEPLMHVMMESLKIKDEAGSVPAEAEPAPKAAPKKAPAKKAPPARVPSEKAPSTPVPPKKMAPQAAAKKKPAAEKTAAVAPKPSPPPPPPSTAVPDELAAAAPQPGAFERATDRSVGKQQQMGRTVKLLIVLGLVIVLAVVVTFGGQLLKQRQLNRRYQQLLADLAVTPELDAQIVLLMQYIKDYPGDAHRGELETRLQTANTEIEKRDYEATILAVNRLPLNEKYEQRALSLYTAFLTKYPQSTYAGQINDAIGGIRQLLGTAYFEDLKKVSASDYLERHAAYRAYLEQFPEGNERKAVERMIAQLAESYHSAIERQTVQCDEAGNWAPCIAQCDRFLSTFADQPPAAKVRRRRAMLQDKADLTDLAATAAQAGNDAAKARKVYTDYLAKRPDTTQRAAIDQRITALDATIAADAEWKALVAYVSRASNDVFARIQRLDGYVESHPSGADHKRAVELRQRLEPELQAAVRARKAEEARRQALAQQRAEAARQAKAAQRIQRLQDQFSRQLRAVAERFSDNGDGTVRDRMTGLTWCLLDSQTVLGQCIDHRSAMDYVNRLTTGGHTDWRLPTAGELATIYKNRPFFPGSGTEWYWTSETFARGYHRVVDVVTSTPETVFQRSTKVENDCGAVRAVRR